MIAILAFVAWMASCTYLADPHRRRRLDARTDARAQAKLRARIDAGVRARS